MNRRIINCDRQKCTGCGICELVCSAYKERVFSPETSRIMVVTETAPNYQIEAVACVLCANPSCIKCCPHQALKKNGKDGPIVVDPERCNGCCACIEACRHGRISYVLEKNRVVICDLCKEQGEPQCVRFCPTGALKLEKVVPIPKKKALERINVSKICDNCGLCVRECQTKAIKVIDGWLTVDDPARCQVCETCATLCPIKAIRINRRVPQSRYVPE